MSFRDKKSIKLGEAISKFLRSEGLETPLNQTRAVTEFQAIVGNLSRHIEQTYIKGQTLHVHVSSAVVRQELHTDKELLINQLREKVGANVVVDIIFH